MSVEEQIASMQATFDAREESNYESRQDIKNNIKDITSNVSALTANLTGVNTEVHNLKDTVSEVKSDVKEGFKSLEGKMDDHFKTNGSNGRRGNKVKKGAIIAGVPSGIAVFIGMIWQVGIQVGWWA